MKKVRIYKQKQSNQYQTGGTYVNPNDEYLKYKQAYDEEQQFLMGGSFKDLNKNIKNYFGNRKKQYGGDIALQNESINSVTDNKKNMFKDYITNNTMSFLSQEALNEQQEAMENNMANYLKYGGMTNQPGYVGNPYLAANIQKQQQLNNLNESSFNTFFDAMNNTNFGKSLVEKTKFLNNPLGQQMKQEYKDLNRQYRQDMRNPLSPYEKMLEQQSGMINPVMAMGGNYPYLPTAQFGVNAPPTMNDYKISEVIAKYGSLENFFKTPEGAKVKNEIYSGQKSNNTTSNKSLYTPEQFKKAYDEYLLTGKVPVKPPFIDPSNLAVMPPNNPYTSNTSSSSTSSKPSYDKKSTPSSTPSSTQTPATSSITGAGATDVENIEKGNVNPNATTSNVTTNENSSTQGNVNNNVTNPNVTGSTGYMTPLGVVYPRTGMMNSVGMSNRNNLPFFYNPENIGKPEIETRRALLPGNRPKKITFTHSLPGQGNQNFANPTPREMMAEAAAAYKGSQPTQPVQTSNYIEDANQRPIVEPNPAYFGLEATVDPNQSVFSNNNPNNINWQTPSNLAYGGVPNYQRLNMKNFQEGGEYDLTDEEIQMIIQNGGEVEYL